MKTLWDLLPIPRAKPQPTRAPRIVEQVARPKPPVRAPASRPTRKKSTAQDRYEAMTRRLLAEYGVRVRKWRSSTSGCAWEVIYADGTVSRLIESPKPKGPMSAAVFLHEIGHHAIGLNRYSPRCLEEYHAWMFALNRMEQEGISITPRVRARVRDSLQYALDKANRRGLKRIPAELVSYLEQTHNDAPPRKR